MSRESIRILLNATYLHLEGFKCVWINVSPHEFKTIFDLKNYILRKLNVDGNFDLYMNGGLLLDEETVTILRENDEVQIISKAPSPVKYSLKQFVYSSRKRNFVESDDCNDAYSKKQKEEISSLSSMDCGEGHFVPKKSKKKKKNETELPNNSENFSSAEKRKKQRDYPMNPDDKSNASNKDIISKKHEQAIVTPSFYGNINEFVEKKSVRVKKKKEAELPRYSENFCYNSLEERKKQKELLIEQTESSVTVENHYSTLIEENQSSKKRHKKKDRKNLSCVSAVTDLDGECSSKSIAVGFTATDLDGECLPQKQKKVKPSKTMVFDAQKVLRITSFPGLSSKGEFNISQHESLSTIVTDINSEEVNNKQPKVKPNRQKKYEEKQQTISGSMIISSSGSSSKDAMNLYQIESSTFATDINSEEINTNQPKKKRKRHRKRKIKANECISDDINNCDVLCNINSSTEDIDESIKRKHILYLSPDRNQKRNYFNNVNEFPTSSTDNLDWSSQPYPKISTSDQSSWSSQPYPKISTPDQSTICRIQDLLSVMASKNSNLPCNENGSTLPDKSTTESIALQNDIENKKKQLYENLPDLMTVPVVGTHIAYKALELDESYSPVASDYREGIVVNYDPDTQEVEIRLFNEIVLPAKSGKFDILGKDEVPEPTIKTYDVLKFCDLIEPKLLSSLPE